MKKFYFTFGSDERYPFPNSYVIVHAANLADAIACFRKHIPDVITGVLNCAFYYTQEEWESTSMFVRREYPAAVYVN